jgi:hypothetical protein
VKLSRQQILGSLLLGLLVFILLFVRARHLFHR